VWNWKYGSHPNLGPLRIVEEKRKRRKIEITGVKYNGLPITMGGHNKTMARSVYSKTHAASASIT